MLEDGLRIVFRIFRDGLSCSELSVRHLAVRCSASRRHRCWTGLHGASARLRCCSIGCFGPRRRGGRASGCIMGRSMSRISAASMRRCWNSNPASRPTRCRACDEGSSRWCSAPNRPGYRGDGAKQTGTGVTWIEDIPAGRFFLRAGIGRKASGSYYTPHAFVRFLVREALAPQIAARSPDTDPDPAAILALKVVDPAMGSGHFLVEACRYLADALYAACRLCDETAAACWKRRNARRRMIGYGCRLVRWRCVAAWPTCPTRMACCSRTCQAGRARVARAACRNRVRWRYAAAWSRCIACTRGQQSAIRNRTRCAGQGHVLLGALHRDL